MIGRGEVGFFDRLQLVRIFVLKRSLQKKKEWSSSEQVPNETVAKNSWRYLFGYIYLPGVMKTGLANTL